MKIVVLLFSVSVFHALSAQILDESDDAVVEHALGQGVPQDQSWLPGQGGLPVPPNGIGQMDPGAPLLQANIASEARPPQQGNIATNVGGLVPGANQALDGTGQVGPGAMGGGMGIPGSGLGQIAPGNQPGPGAIGVPSRPQQIPPPPGAGLGGAGNTFGGFGSGAGSHFGNGFGAGNFPKPSGSNDLPMMSSLHGSAGMANNMPGMGLSGAHVPLGQQSGQGIQSGWPSYPFPGAQNAIQPGFVGGMPSSSSAGGSYSHPYASAMYPSQSQSGYGQLLGLPAFQQSPFAQPQFYGRPNAGAGWSAYPGFRPSWMSNGFVRPGSK